MIGIIIGLDVELQNPMKTAIVADRWNARAAISIPRTTTTATIRTRLIIYHIHKHINSEGMFGNNQADRVVITIYILNVRLYARPDLGLKRPLF